MSLVRSIVFWGLTLVLAFLFAFAGLNKLTDQLDPKLNAQLVSLPVFFFLFLLRASRNSFEKILL